MMRRAFSWAFGERGEGLAEGLAILVTCAAYVLVVCSALVLACGALWVGSLLLRELFP